ncbi:MAG TPA: LLM class F420-dependent oxidoreductase [Candidatus Dormibacteraeota bacterium]|nr:LLM class F420-dependent oxidoreductase [Candidatus Dormibacteraeota bacterium]
MKFGIAIFATDRSIGVAELARAVEERGYDSLWFPEHTHIPTSRLSPWPGGPELPEHYKRTLDPFVSVAVAASNTTRLRLGFGILLLVERDPITTAKEVASVDLVSNGRVVLGVGAGWNREEMQDHGTDPRTRFKLMRERVLAMREIWTRDEAQFHGDFVDFEPMWSWPKPIQNPLPVYLGGNAENAMKRVIEFADGWMPMPGRSSLAEQIPAFRRLCEETGRGRLPVVVSGARSTAEAIEEYRELGVDEATFYVPSTSRDDAFRELDRITELSLGAQ